MELALMLLVLPVSILALCIRNRKHPLRVFAICGGALTFYLVFYGIAKYSDNYTFSLTFLDPNRQPVPALPVEYTCWGGSDRFSRRASKPNGSAQTDEDGKLILRLNHATSIAVTVRDPRFEFGRFSMEAAGTRYGHQIIPDSSLTYIEPLGPPPSTGVFHGSWVFDIQPEHKFVVALKPAETSAANVKQTAK
jgi:hypothetical protein